MLEDIFANILPFPMFLFFSSPTVIRMHGPDLSANHLTNLILWHPVLNCGQLWICCYAGQSSPIVCRSNKPYMKYNTVGWNLNDQPKWANTNTICQFVKIKWTKNWIPSSYISQTVLMWSYPVTGFEKIVNNKCRKIKISFPKADIYLTLKCESCYFSNFLCSIHLMYFLISINA